jgi:hypothetical protein
LRELGAATRTENGTPELFTGDGSALAGSYQHFQTPHGDIEVSVHTPTGDQGRSGIDALADGIVICVYVPTPKLRSYVATGKFPGLGAVLEIIEIFEEDEDPES